MSEPRTTETALAVPEDADYSETPAGGVEASPSAGDPNPFWGRSGFLAFMAIVFLPAAWVLALLRPQGHRFAALVGVTAFAAAFAVVSSAAFAGILLLA